MPKMSSNKRGQVGQSSAGFGLCIRWRSLLHKPNTAPSCRLPRTLGFRKNLSMCIETIIQISKGLLTPLIAIIATYIAWQQWKTNQQKLNLERYDRRLAVYEEVVKILSIVVRDADASYEDLLNFRASISEADFLFGEEIPIYIDEIYKRGINLRRWNKEYRDYSQPKPDGYDHKKVVDEGHKEILWFSKQFAPAKEKFMPYLDISK